MLILSQATSPTVAADGIADVSAGLLRVLAVRQTALLAGSAAAVTTGSARGGTVLATRASLAVSTLGISKSLAGLHNVG